MKKNLNQGEKSKNPEKKPDYKNTLAKKSFGGSSIKGKILINPHNRT